MNTPQLLFAAIMMTIGTSCITAQTITCDWFSITGIEPDTIDTNNTIITIEMGGTNANFANYPYIASVTDCTGDTVATGGMFYFGQIGGTEQGYPVSLLSADVCLPLSIEFIYGNDNNVIDTCLLTFDGPSLCNLFSITGIEPDTLNPNNTLINIQMDGDPFDQINYPRISIVTDCFGDTVATGDLFYFGQLGQTTLGYPISAIGNDVCFPINLQFDFEVGEVFPDIYSCILTLNGLEVNVPNEPLHSVGVFPNPTHDEFVFTTAKERTNKAYIIYDAAGKQLRSGIITGMNTTIRIGDLPNGVYLVRLGNDEVKVVKGE